MITIFRLRFCGCFWRIIFLLSLVTFCRSLLRFCLFLITCIFSLFSALQVVSLFYSESLIMFFFFVFSFYLRFFYSFSFIFIHFRFCLALKKLQFFLLILISLWILFFLFVCFNFHRLFNNFVFAGSLSSFYSFHYWSNFFFFISLPLLLGILSLFLSFLILCLIQTPPFSIFF